MTKLIGLVYTLQDKHIVHLQRILEPDADNDAAAAAIFADPNNLGTGESMVVIKIRKFAQLPEMMVDITAALFNIGRVIV